MALKKTQLLDITSVTGIATVGILTVGVTQTAGGVGIASTTYMKNIIMHNTGLGTARVSLYVNPNTTPVLGYGVTANRFLRVDIAPNEEKTLEYFWEDRIMVSPGTHKMTLRFYTGGGEVTYTKDIMPTA